MNSIKFKMGCLLITLFVLVWLGVYLQADWIGLIDEIGRQILFGWIKNDLSYFFLAIAAIGDIFITAVLLLITTIMIWIKNKRLSIWVFSVVVFSGGIIPQILKYIVARPRPEYGLYTRGGYSFPSGHATGATVFYGMLIILALMCLKKSRQRGIFVSIAATLIILIGWSRIYLGVHYTSDVIAGIFLGIGQILIWLDFYERRKN